MANLIYVSETNLIINMDQIALIELEEADPGGDIPDMLNLTTSSGAPLTLPAKGAGKLWKKLIEISQKVEGLEYSENSR